MSTRCPTCARPAARLTVVVVLPTPPFWLAMQKMCGMGGLSLLAHAHPNETAFSIEPRHLKLFHLKHFNVCRQGLHLVLWVPALHRHPHTARRQQIAGERHEIQQGRKGPRG